MSDRRERRRNSRRGESRRSERRHRLRGGGASPPGPEQSGEGAAKAAAGRRSGGSTPSGRRATTRGGAEAGTGISRRHSPQTLRASLPAFDRRKLVMVASGCGAFFILFLVFVLVVGPLLHRRGLIADLRHENDQLGRSAAEELGRRWPPDALASFCALLEEEARQLQERGAYGLGFLGRPDTPLTAAANREIAVLLGANRTDKCALGIYAAGFTGTGQHVKALADIIRRDEDEELRRAAIQALGRLQRGEAVSVLLWAMQNTQGDLLQEAKEAFGTVCEKAPSGELLAALDHQDAEVRLTIMRELLRPARLEHEETATALQRGFRDPEARLRQLAAQNAWRSTLGGKAVVSGLRRLLLEDAVAEVKLVAAQALGFYRADADRPSAREAVLEAITRGPDDQLQAALCEALGKLRTRPKEPEILLVLIEKLRSAEGQTAQAIMRGLSAATAGRGEKNPRAAYSKEQWLQWHARQQEFQKLYYPARDELLRIDQLNHEGKLSDTDAYPRACRAIETMELAITKYADTDEEYAARKFLQDAQMVCYRLLKGSVVDVRNLR